MTTIREPARDIPVAHECDLCVVGGSCTGVFAALRAAGAGLRVALVEMQGGFGGTATAGLVSIWHSLYDITGKTPIIGGLTREVIDHLHGRGEADVADPANASRYAVLNTEALKIDLDARVRAAGVRPFLHARFCAPLMEEGRVSAVVIEDKSGRRAIRAKVFVDASGDGDLVHRAGFPTWTPDYMQPPTTCCVVEGLRALAESHPRFNLARTVFDSDNPKALRKGFLWTASHPAGIDLTLVAGTRVHGVDCSDGDDLTAAEMEGRRQVGALLELVRAAAGTSLPLTGLAGHIGIRETRHAECLHRLTEAEVLRGVRFDDAIAQGSYRVDIHHQDGAGLTFRYLDGREERVEPGRQTVESRWASPEEATATFYQIPYRCLVPKGAVNVLCAGRMFDADPGAFGAARVMVNCNQMGEAAGLAAALALESGRSVDAVDTAVLRDRLRAAGAVLT